MTLRFKEKANKPEELINILTPTVKKWFFSRFKEFSIPQLYGVLPIHTRQNILVSAPTGATKTLTGFLSVLNELVDLSEKGLLENRIYCVYVSPLKALSYDIEVNLLNPLKEMEEMSGKNFGIRVGVRTGDTTQAEKAKMFKHPPHILITTPESLAIMITSIKFKEFFKGVEWCIIDEVHALAENKRGVHLSLTLERLQRITEFTRVGLSATVAPIEEVAKFLVGDRDCEIVDVQFIKQLNLKVISPVPNLVEVSADTLNNKLYELLDNLIQQHKTTLVFTNTRAATERVVHHLKEKYPQNYLENIGAHHGSLSAAHRRGIEKRLREGKLKCVVSSTSLELGIDIGFVDLVILLGSPKSVARALQRIGRSGHQLHATTKGRIVVLDRDDLIECSVLLKNAIEKKIDKIHIPTNCLDVLAQQIVGIALEDNIHIDELYKTIKKSYCYHNLNRTDFGEIIDYLTGKYVSLEDRWIFAKIWYDEETGFIGRKGKLGRVIYMTNIGTIPDETGMQVKIGEQTIWMIDEAFLERLKRGDIFVLGGDTYQFLFARGMVAQVQAVAGKKPTVPSWFSEMLPLSYDLANDIGKFRRLMEEKFKGKNSKKDIIQFINDYLYVDENSANAIYEYFYEQFAYSEIPSDKKLLIEYYIEDKKHTAIFHTLLGRRVNDALSRAVGFAIGRMQHKDVEIGISDNGFYVSYTKSVNPLKAFKSLKSKELYKVLELAIGQTEVLKRRFRHCAMRSFMILRSYKGHTKHVGRQQVSSMILLNAVRRISENFPILKEAKREVLEDLMDINNAAAYLKKFENDEIKVVESETRIPSPFSFNLVMQGYVDLLKIEDKIDFARRMHRMILAKISLKKDGDKELLKKYRDVIETPLSYEDIWKKSEEKKEENKNDELDKLKKMAWNAPHVPGYAKMELVKLIEGERHIRDDVLKAIEKHKDEIKKRWPKELSEFILKAVQEC